MICSDVEERDSVERYLRGGLGETELQELEEHYFACDECFEILRDQSALRSALAERPRAVSARQVPGRRAWLAAAAVVVLGIGIAIVLFARVGPDDATLEIARLAAIEAPSYTPTLLRSPGGQAERRFREAMVLYQASDYAGAIPDLEAAAGLDATSARIAFYLGVCYLLTDRPVPAIDNFGRVVELGATPYLESARLYRAKAYLRVGDLDAARTELDKVVHIGGRLEAEARQILDRLPR